MMRIFLIIIPALVLMASACSSNRLEVDVTGIEADVEIVRFETDLYSLPPATVAGKVGELREKYGEFYNTFTYKVIPLLGNPDDADYSARLTDYLSNPTTKDAHKAVQKDFADFTAIEAEIEAGFRHLKYYYPDSTLPRIYTCLTAFQLLAFTEKDFVGIGLDMYLGEKNKLYDDMDFPQYLDYHFAPKRIALDCLGGWADSMIDYNDSVNNVATNIIFTGRAKYFLSALFPDKTIGEIMGYSDEQIKWCTANESQIWNTLVNEKLLFSNDGLDITKLTGEAPYTKYLPQQSPGRVGVWLGYQIVKAYHEKNEHLSLQDLMAERDYQKILNQSKYNP